MVVAETVFGVGIVRDSRGVVSWGGRKADFGRRYSRGDNPDWKGVAIEISARRERLMARHAWLWALASIVLVVSLVGCGRSDDSVFGVGYKVRYGDLEVFAVTPPERFVGRAPLMSPGRAAQEELDAALREEHPEFFAPTDPPPVGTRAMAEFEPVDAVYMAFDAETEQFTKEVIRAVLPVVPVVVTLTDDESPERFENLLLSGSFGGSDVHLINLRHDNFWTRDFGPVSVELPDGRPAFLDFIYPQTRVLDDGLPSALALAYQVPVYRVPLKMEGGVFMTNGDGLCVTTTSLAVGNPELSFEELSRGIERALGCSQLVFLESPRNEPTGHVDMIAKFTQRDTLLLGSFDPGDSPEDAALMDRNAGLLKSIETGRGRRLQVVRIPMPAAEGDLYRSYTNSLLVNKTAVVPTYGDDPHRQKSALGAYRRALPVGWQLKTVDASSAIGLGGAIHCAALELRLAN